MKPPMKVEPKTRRIRMGRKFLYEFFGGTGGVERPEGEGREGEEGDGRGGREREGERKGRGNFPLASIGSRAEGDNRQRAHSA